MKLESGRHDIQGDELFAIVDQGTGKSREKAMLEYHRKYIDIQFVISGEDCIGWLPTKICNRPSGEFVPDKDLGFFFDRPKTWVQLSPNEFAIFYPEDAHAPLASTTGYKKVVLKVKL